LDKAALVAEKEICGTFWADETSVNLSDTSGFTHKKPHQSLIVVVLFLGQK